MIKNVHLCVDSNVEYFEHFFVNFDLTKNKNSVVIKFWTCTVNILYQFYVKYFSVFIVESNNALQIKPTKFRPYIDVILICVDVKKSHLKSVQ